MLDLNKTNVKSLQLGKMYGNDILEPNFFPVGIFEGQMYFR